MTTRSLTPRLLLLAATALPLAACGPNYEQVADRLRRQNLKLEQDLAAAQAKAAQTEKRVAELMEQLDKQTPRVPTLPRERLDAMFTVSRVELRNAEARDFDGDNRLDGFRVFVRPYASGGETLPATGTLTVEAFDLSLQEGSQRLASLTVPPAELKKQWYGMLGLNQFGVNVPWTRKPEGEEITFRIRFVEALTGDTFTDQRAIKVKLQNEAATKPS